MKKLIALIAVLAIARENPFVLPKERTSTSKPSESILMPVHKISKVQVKKANMKKKPVRSSLPQTRPSSQGRVQKLADYGFLKILFHNDTLRLDTKDPLLRTFTLDTPKKVVFDFSKKRHFSSKRIVLNQGAFKNISIGAHKNFYRVAVEIEKSCKPKITALELTCR